MIGNKDSGPASVHNGIHFRSALTSILLSSGESGRMVEFRGLPSGTAPQRVQRMLESGRYLLQPPGGNSAWAAYLQRRDEAMAKMREQEGRQGGDSRTGPSRPFKTGMIHSVLHLSLA